MNEPGQYILASELAALFAVWLAPPLLFAWAAQAVALLRRGIRLRRVIACFISTAALSVPALLLAFAIDSPIIRRFNSALMLPPPHELWVLPMAIPVVAIVAATVAMLFLASAPKGR